MTRTIADTALLRQALQALPEPVIATDTGGVVVVWNRAAEELFGWAADEALGRHASDVGWADALADPQTWDMVRQVRAGASWEGSFTVATKGGRSLLARFRAAPLHDSVGRFSGVVMTASDLLGPRYAQQRAATRLALLSRAGMLLGTSLDVDSTLASIAELLVPSMADHCVVDLFDDTRSLVRLVSVHADEVERAVTDGPRVGERIAYPPDHPCFRALAAGHAVVARNVELPAPVTLPYGSSHPVVTGRPGTPTKIHAVVAVPLLGPNSVRGVLFIANSISGRDYDSGDVDLIEELAARAGLALDNAHLYDRQRKLALTLQHSLLPDELPSTDGVSLAFGYDPAADSEVGGDLYDVVGLSAGRVGIVIGDVQGRGAHAAAVMGQLRAALRAYAVLDLEPAQLLTHLDELVRGLNEALLVTCVYAVYDPFTRRCVLSNAGHLPPLLAGADGCFPLEVPPDVPLGVGGVPYTDHSFTVPPGDTLVLYTDGVVERRDRAVDEGVRALCRMLADVGPDPERLCRAALLIAPAHAEDDQAVLAVRTAAWELPFSRVVLLAVPEAAAAARQHARRVLQQWELEDQADIAELLVSELVTNAVRHSLDPRDWPAPGGTAADERMNGPDGDQADGPDGSLAARVGLRVLGPDEPAPDAASGDRRIELVLRRGRRALWAEVHDPDVRLPRLRVAAVTDEGGRGLYLVDALSNRWGARPTSTGKAVWFELSLDERASAAQI